MADERVGDAKDQAERVRVMSGSLPRDVYEKLQRVAERESYSVATYVARLILKDMQKKRV